MLYRHFIAGLVAFLAASGLGPGVRVAHAQGGDTTFRVEKPDILVRSRASLKSQVVAPAPVGTVLVVMDREEGWLWVLLPPDVNGTRHPGWVRETDLQAPGEGESTDETQPKNDKDAKKKAAGEGRQLQLQQAQESERLKQEQVNASRQAKLQAEADRKLKAQQEAEERRLQQQQVLADRRAKQQQAEEDRRLERAKRELEKAKQDFEKVAKSEPSEPAK